MAEKTTEEQLIKLQAEFDEFTYIVSHDLKAPLRAISNISQWIEEDFGPDIDEDIIDNFKLLKGRVAKLDQMIDAITKYSRIKRRENDIVDTDINELLNDIKDDIEHRYTNAIIQFDSTFSTITTYSKKLYQVLEEVVENAVKHNSTEPKVKVVIRQFTEEHFICFEIEDDGKGISSEMDETIFKLFYTLEAKDKSATVGAGLSIVKAILDFVEGEVKVEHPDSGLKIVIKWPLNV